MDIESIKESTKTNGEFEPFINGYDRGFSDGKKKGKIKHFIIGGILGFIGSCALEVITNRKDIREQFKKEHLEETDDQVTF